MAKKYERLGVMIDMSRNAVMSISGLKRFLPLLKKMGYNMVLFYMEDTYEVIDEPYFGYMRGRYSIAEMKELDAFATSLGIEIIPCIQTLAHLATATRWPDFAGYIDIDDVLMVGDERTYKFVEAAISVCRECFRSGRVNLGMDEAWRIGRGTYLDKTGQVPRSDILCDHLGRVVEICKKHDVEPMIWSDMFWAFAVESENSNDNNFNLEKMLIKPDAVLSLDKIILSNLTDYQKSLLTRLAYIDIDFKEFQSLKKKDTTRTISTLKSLIILLFKSSLAL